MIGSENHIKLTIFLGIYYFVHSLLASSKIKNWFYKSGIKPRIYRLIYSFIATIFLVTILLFKRSFDSTFIFGVSLLLELVGQILLIMGSFIVYMSFRYFSSLAFIGLIDDDESNVLIRKGLHKHVRHPIYSGTVLILIGYFLISPTLSTTILVALSLLYLPIGIHFEENKLIKQFGDKYVKYKSEVPAIFPWPS